MLYFREVWRSLFFTLLISLLVGPCSAILFNVTVDDSFPDPVTGTSIVYSPATSWFAGGSDCSNCTARLDPNQANRGTWHENAFFPIWEGNIPAEVVSTATFQFQGSALYVYCIIAHTSFDPDATADMTFFIDGDVVGEFALEPTGSGTIDFNVPVYVNESMPDGMHTFTLQNGHLGGVQSLVLLDSIVYTRDDPTLTATPLPPPSIVTSSPTELTLVPPNPVSSSSSLQGPPDAQTPASQSIGTAFRALSPQARIGVIVAASFGGTGLLASAVLVGMCLQRRAYRAYKLPPETFKDRTNDLSGDPSTSGWVAGTWPKPKQPMRHSLMALQALKRGTRVKRRRSQMSGSETNTHTSTSRPSIDYSEPTSPGLDRSIRRSLIDSGAVSLLGSTNLVGGYTPAILLSPASLSSLRRDRPSGSTNGPGPQEAGSSTGGYLFPSSFLPQSPRSLASSSSQATDTSVTYIPRSIVSDAPPRLELNLPSQRNRSASADAATVRFTPNRRPELLRSGNTLQGIPVRVPRPSGFNIRRKPVTIAYEGNDGGSPTYESR